MQLWGPMESSPANCRKFETSLLDQTAQLSKDLIAARNLPMEWPLQIEFESSSF
jgi:hypothetical protein